MKRRPKPPTLKAIDLKIRTVALDAVLRAAANLKGWDLKSGGQLLHEAGMVEGWLKSGTLPAEEKTKGKK